MAYVDKIQTIYTLPLATWLYKAAIIKGIKQDRQHLGIILAKHEKIKIRQVNAKFTENLTLRLLNDDKTTEAMFTVGNTWLEASVKAISVPFIDTPEVSSTDEKPVIEFQYPDNTKVLPVYRDDVSQEDFFERWDTNDAEFALLELDYLRLLVPKICKEKVKLLDKLVPYYQTIFTYYNALAGLSFEPEYQTDLNIRNRYFAKVDQSSNEDVYYSLEWMAEGKNSINEVWLSPVSDNWACLSTIAEGYGFYWPDVYVGNSDISQAGVWSKIYAACYQEDMLGEDKYLLGWLYNYGNQVQVEDNIMTLISGQVPIKNWDERSTLYALILMIMAGGKNAFIDFNQQYRRRANNKNFYFYQNLILDIFSDSAALVANKVDINAFIQLIGGELSRQQCNRNVVSKANVIYPLYQLVDKTKLNEMKSLLNSQSVLQLVDTVCLDDLGLKGNVILHLNIDDFDQLFGEKFVLMDGARDVYSVPIVKSTLELTELPVGVYTLRFPMGKDKKYQTLQNYLIVKEGTTSLQIDFISTPRSSIVSQEIEFLGLAEERFATVRVDRTHNNLVIDVIKTTPHAEFPNQLYAKIAVRDEQENVRFNRFIFATDETVSHYELPFKLGYQLELYHLQPSLLRVHPDEENLIDNKNDMNILTFEKTGMKNIALKTDPTLGLLQRIDKAANHLRHYLPAYHTLSTWFKTDIYTAITLIDSPQREELMIKYADCIPENNTPPKDSLQVGSDFTVIFRGADDGLVLKATLNLVKQMMHIIILPRIANTNFSDVYISITCEDFYGNPLYHYEVVGNKKQDQQSVDLPLYGYGVSVIRLYHKEDNQRLIIINDNQSERLTERGYQQDYCLTGCGLQRINK